VKEVAVLVESIHLHSGQAPEEEEDTNAYYQP